MAVTVKSVIKKSPAYKLGIKAGDTLIKINGEEITDVLDYKFYEADAKTVEFIGKSGKIKLKKVKKMPFDELGLEFETYLMDEKKHCKNKCIFCFVDQLPKGMRKSLYFKDDDSRLSFLFGNYITLTNLSEHEIDRIIKMHISPINVSVHTTNEELRVKMMGNKNAGKVLEILDKFDNAGIKINAQLVLCPGFNDKEELKKTLADLIALKNTECIACVPVGLTKWRDGLEELVPFNKESAAETIDIIDYFGDKTLKENGIRRVFAADEFYLTAKRQIPSFEFYGDFLQLDNGVGMWALLKHEAELALKEAEKTDKERKVSLVTGVAAYPLIKEIAENITEKNKNIKCFVYEIKNEFFGDKITVSGLITAADIKNQLKGKDLGEEMLIPSSMLNSEQEMFLDSVTLKGLQKDLGVKITPVYNDGYDLTDKILG